MLSGDDSSPKSDWLSVYHMGEPGDQSITSVNIPFQAEMPMVCQRPCLTKPLPGQNHKQAVMEARVVQGIRRIRRFGWRRRRRRGQRRGQRGGVKSEGEGTNGRVAMPPIFSPRRTADALILRFILGSA